MNGGLRVLDLSAGDADDEILQPSFLNQALVKRIPEKEFDFGRPLTAIIRADEIRRNGTDLYMESKILWLFLNLDRFSALAVATFTTAARFFTISEHSSSEST